ncbi:Triose-phosphate Transporter [Phlyctochytrium planicorne]|nr:Triose-phosphate Transporter [Phlyctochytrium planicorne]
MEVETVRFSWTGFFLVLFAAISSGLRWNLTQILITAKSEAHFGPVTTLNNLSPMMSVLLGFGALLLESQIIFNSPFFSDFKSTAKTIGLLSIGGLLALCMTLAEFYLISKTNVVTLSVAVFIVVVDAQLISLQGYLQRSVHDHIINNFLW